MNKARLALLFLAALLAAACHPDGPSIEELMMSETSATLDIGQSLSLKVTSSPSGAEVSGLQWSSLDKLVATVDNDGKVTAAGGGVAVIRATDSGSGKSALCRVTVRDPGQSEVLLDPNDRWADTGVNVPAYPSYGKVTNLVDFPHVEIWTESLKPVQSKTNYEKGSITVHDPLMMYSDVTLVPKMSMMIRGRGNTTWEGPNGKKNPYRIKLPEHTKLLGMKGDKDWILLPDQLDNSLLRTALAMRISRLVSMPWTPRFRIVDLYINGAYAGMYYLMEQKEVDRENKVPITVSPGQVRSGYLLELDIRSEDVPYFISKYFKKKLKFKDPTPQDGTMNDLQKKYIIDYCETLEKKLMDREFTGPDNYREYIELDTWVQQFIVHELSMNIDGNMRLSTYIAKDADTKLFIPFCWDFDRAFGNASYMKNEFNVPEEYPSGWFVRIRGGNESDKEYPFGYRATWYQYMFEDPVFVDRLKELWALYKPRLDYLPAYIDKMTDYCRPALEHDGLKFNKDHFGSISRLRSRFLERLHWMDVHIRALEPQRYNPATGDYEDIM